MTEQNEMYKNPCSRCSDENGYIKVFSHVMGGVCFKCKGLGYTLSKTDPKILVARREKAANHKKANRDEKIKNANLMREQLVLKYKDDPRISDEMKARCSEFVAVAMETYDTLERIDNGKYPYADSLPWYIAQS
jgi:hypothetical protein